jgi:hypothetical protein
MRRKLTGSLLLEPEYLSPHEVIALYLRGDGAVANFEDE